VRLAAAAPEPGPPGAGDVATARPAAPVEPSFESGPGEPFDALPGDAARTDPADEAAPVGYPDPQHIG
jgi:hypothetical protein